MSMISRDHDEILSLLTPYGVSEARSAQFLSAPLQLNIARAGTLEMTSWRTYIFNGWITTLRNYKIHRDKICIIQMA